MALGLPKAEIMKIWAFIKTAVMIEKTTPDIMH